MRSNTYFILDYRSWYTPCTPAYKCMCVCHPILWKKCWKRKFCMMPKSEKILAFRTRKFEPKTRTIGKRPPRKNQNLFFEIKKLFLHSLPSPEKKKNRTTIIFKSAKGVRKWPYFFKISKKYFRIFTKKPKFWVVIDLLMPSERTEKLGTIPDV